MVKAYIMVITSAGTVQDVLSEIEKLDHVIEANAVAGDYDVIVEVEADEPGDLLPTIASEMQGIDGVGNTRTYITLT